MSNEQRSSQSSQEGEEKRPPYRKGESKESDATILTALAALVTEKGLRFRMTDLAERAQVSVGRVYLIRHGDRRVGGKENLIGIMVTYCLQDLSFEELPTHYAHWILTMYQRRAPGWVQQVVRKAVEDRARLEGKTLDDVRVILGRKLFP